MSFFYGIRKTEANPLYGLKSRTQIIPFYKIMMLSDNLTKQASIQKEVTDAIKEETLTENLIKQKYRQMPKGNEIVPTQSGGMANPRYSNQFTFGRRRR